MFGVGFGELVVLAFLAVLVFGPDRLPELAQQAGRLLKQLRQFATNARDELRSELGPEYADLELRDLDPRAIVRKHIAEAMAELDDLEDAVSGTSTLAAQKPLEAGERPPYDVDAT